MLRIVDRAQENKEHAKKAVRRFRRKQKGKPIPGVPIVSIRETESFQSSLHYSENRRLKLVKRDRFPWISIKRVWDDDSLNARMRRLLRR